MGLLEYRPPLFESLPATAVGNAYRKIGMDARYLSQTWNETLTDSLIQLSRSRGLSAEAADAITKKMNTSAGVVGGAIIVGIAETDGYRPNLEQRRELLREGSWYLLTSRIVDDYMDDEQGPDITHRHNVIHDACQGKTPAEYVTPLEEGSVILVQDCMKRYNKSDFPETMTALVDGYGRQMNYRASGTIATPETIDQETDDFMDVNARLYAKSFYDVLAAKVRPVHRLTKEAYEHLIEGIVWFDQIVDAQSDLESGDYNVLVRAAQAAGCTTHEDILAHAQQHRLEYRHRVDTHVEQGFATLAFSRKATPDNLATYTAVSRALKMKYVLEGDHPRLYNGLKRAKNMLHR